MTNPAPGPGARLGHFTIIARLGAGGMGEVCRAHDESLKREARSAAGLNHPHICTIHEVGEE